MSDAGPTLPEGTVTMLFSDIEGSTALLDRLGPDYRQVLSRQRQVMRQAIGEHGGFEMGTEGDSFFVVFPRAADAVRAAVNAQQALTATAWPEGGQVRVRMGLHTGEPVRHEDGYVGMDVHRAARVAASSRSGQVLLTSTTWGLAGAQLGDLEATDLGWHQLKDISTPERLYQVIGPGMERDIGRVRSMGSAADLPAPSTPIVGRDEDVRSVVRLLEEGSRRLVTLLGPGGVGKTRLAIAIAEHRAPSLTDGVYFVPLARATTQAEFWDQLADVVGESSEQRAPERLLSRLRSSRLLLVLDNLEQLPDAARVVAQVIDSCPRVEIIATSRSPLRLNAEQLVPVDPLGPDKAAELFVERMRHVRPNLTPDGEDIEAITTLCRRVDGLPLAVELLAARTRLMGPRAMLTRFDSALDAPGRTVDRPDRQRTIRDTLDWSRQLLTDEQAQALARLGVFRGPFTFEDAAAVIDRPAEESLEILLDLVDASLVRTSDGPTGDPEFRMLRIVSRYAVERLSVDPAELAETRARHAVQVAEVVRHLCGQLRGTRHIAALDALAQQAGNIRAALDWTLHPGSEHLATGLDICRLMSWYWYASGRQEEGRRWLTRAREAAGESEDPLAVRALHGLAVLLSQGGRLEEAAEILEHCLQQARRTGDREAEGRECNSLGIVLRSLRQVGRARELYLTAIRLAREDHAPERLSNALTNLAELEVEEGRSALALELFDEVLRLDQERGDAWGIGVDRLNIAATHLAAGHLDTAQHQMLAHADQLLALGDTEVTVELLENLALLAGHRGQAGLTALLLGAADTIRQMSHVPRTPVREQELREGTAPARGALDPVAWETAYQEGTGLTAPDAMAAARSTLELHPAGMAGAEGAAQ